MNSALSGISDADKRKWIMRANLITFILMIALAQVSAATFAQKLTYSKQGASLQEIFKEIKTQTGYNVLYSPDQIDVLKKINVNFKQADLKKVLERLIDDETQEYAIVDNNILIKKKETSFLDKARSVTLNLFQGLFQSIDVRGRVVDSETGNALAGATVRMKGTNKQTSTNGNGEFYLADVEENAMLEISFIGFVKIEVKAGKDLGEIKLVMASSELQEVTINKGYYTTTRTLNTGNVSTVTARDIERQPVTDPMLALQGRVPGLFVQQNSGVPGRENTIQLRGQNSIANGNSPLFIVDGIPYDSKTPTVNPGSGGFPLPMGFSASPFSYLNPSDIESIQVLKDGDATAIYGSRGANGVILITTKQGKAGKTQIDVNFSSGVEKTVQRVNFMNTHEYLEMRRQATAHSGQTIQPTDYDLNGTWDQNRYTDWQDFFIGNSAEMTNASVVLSGGGELTNFRVSGNYRKQGTIFPGDHASKMASSQFSLNHRSSNNKLKVLLSGTYADNFNDLPQSSISNTVFYAPNSPQLYTDDSSLNWENGTFQNPMAAYEVHVSEKNMNLIGGLTVGYNLLKNLNIKSSFTYNASDFKQTNLKPLTASSPNTITAFINAGLSPNNLRSHSFSTRKGIAWNLEPQLTYNENILRGKLEFLIGTTFQRSNGEFLAMYGEGYSSDLLIKDYSSAATIMKLGSGNSEYRYSAVYSRIGYSYQDKYVLNFTLRRDGSSRYGDANKFGNFGSIAAAWIFSNEIKDKLSWLSFGKMRASYATTGNDQLLDYEYLDTYSTPSPSLSYQGVNSLRPTQLTNPYYGWERVNKLEFGLELGFFNNRLNLNSSYYINKTKDQLVPYGLPSVAGFTSVRANIPAVIRNTGLELDLNSVNIKGKDFSWSTSASISFPRNKLVSYPNIEASSYATRYVVGKPLSIQFLYHYTGIDPQTKLYTFQDKNGDGQITSAFDRSAIFRGQDFFGGLQNNIKWKRIELDFFIQFTKQNGFAYYFNTSTGFFNGGIGSDISLDKSFELQDRRIGSASTPANNFKLSDGPLVDASFIRLKNVSVNYSVPIIKCLQKNIQSFSIYFSGQNLLTFSKYQGFDPEAPSLSASGIISSLRTVTVGIRASF